jgi:hypothetical protein
MPQASAISRFQVTDGDHLADFEFVTAGSTTTEADAEFEVDDAAYVAAVPPAGATVVHGIELWVDGAVVDQSNLTGAITVTRDISRSIQTCSFSTKKFAFGDPQYTLGPVICKDEDIDVYGVYKTATGTYRIKLFTGGVLDSPQVAINGDGSVIETYSAVDRGGRFQRSIVTYIIPAGSGLDRAYAAQKIMTEAGATTFDLESSGTINKEIQAIDADPVRLCQELFDVNMRRGLFNARGEYANPRLKSEASAAVLTYTQANILAGPITVSIPADAITSVTANGQRQVMPDPETPCGMVSTVNRLEVVEAFTPEAMAKKQATTGVITTITPNTIEADHTTQLVVRTVTKKCNVLMVEKVETYAWLNHEKARYILNSTGADYVLCYLRTGAAADDSSEGFQWTIEKFIKVSEETIEHFWDAGADTEYYAGGSTVFRRDGAMTTAGIPGFGTSHFSQKSDATFRSETPGGKLGTIRTLKTWINPEAALKSRVGHTDDWESESYNFNTLTLASGVGVDNVTKSFSVSEMDFELLYSNALGYLVRRDVFSTRYRRRGGFNHLYSDGSESRDPTDIWMYSFKTNETWFEETANSTTHVKSDVNEITGERVTTTETTEGSLPAIERLPGYETDELQDLTADEQANLPDRFDPGESEPMVVTVEADFSPSCYQDRSEKISVAYAENEEELEFVADAMIDESIAWRVTLTAPANFLLFEGDKVHLTLPSYNIDHDATVRSIQHSWSGAIGDPVLSAIQLRLHTEVAA